MLTRLLVMLVIVATTAGPVAAQLAFEVVDTHPRSFTEEEIEQLRSSCGIANQSEWPSHWQTHETRTWDPLVAKVTAASASLVTGLGSPPSKSEWATQLGPNFEAAAGVYLLGMGQGGDAQVAAEMARDKLYGWIDDTRTRVEAFGSFADGSR